MHVALIKANVVINICLWNDLDVWQPRNEGLCDATCDVSGTAVGPGWTWSLATLTFLDPGSGAQVVVSSSAVNIAQ